MKVTHEDLRQGRLNIYKLTGDEAADLVAEFEAVLADRDRLCVDLANANVLEDTLQHRIDELEQERERLLILLQRWLASTTDVSSSEAQETLEALNDHRA